MYWMMLTPTGWQKIQLGGKPRAPLWNWLHDRTQTANRSFFPGILHYLLTMSDPIPSPLWNLGFAKFSFNSSALSSTLPQYAKGCVQDILKAPFEVRTFEAIWCILDLGSLAQLAFKLLVWTLQHVFIGPLQGSFIWDWYHLLLVTLPFACIFHPIKSDANYEMQITRNRSSAW